MWLLLTLPEFWSLCWLTLKPQITSKLYRKTTCSNLINPSFSSKSAVFGLGQVPDPGTATWYGTNMVGFFRPS